MGSELKMKISFVLITMMFLLIFSAICFAQWSTDPADNTMIGYWGLSPRIVTDGEGGAIITWALFWEYPQGIDILAQRVDSAGYLQWNMEGISICNEKLDQDFYDIISDDSGGAYISWTDYRQSVNPEWTRDSSDVYLQHINKDGEILLPGNGLLVSTGHDNAGGSKMVPDQNGGVIVAWGDERNPGGPYWKDGLFMQRISAEGECLWEKGGIQITAIYGYFDMVADREGGAILLLKNEIFRINSQGEVLWHVSETPEGINDNALIPDGSGGCIFWYVTENNPGHNNSNYSSFAQRLTSNGDFMWGENGILISSQIPRYWGTFIVPDGEHGAYISWMDSLFICHYDRIDSSGQLLWSADSLSFGYSYIGQHLTNSKANELMIIYMDNEYPYEIKIQKIDKNGLKLWDKNGVIFTLQEETYSFDFVADGTGGTIITWYTISSNRGVYAQRVNKYGKLGNITTVLEFNENIAPISFLLNQNYPNPFNNQTSISYQINKSTYVVLKIYDITGKEVITLVDEFQNLGNHRVVWNGKNNKGGDVASGIYFYQLKINELVQTKKLTLIQ